jgi:hypothetical protein
MAFLGFFGGGRVGVEYLDPRRNEERLWFELRRWPVVEGEGVSRVVADVLIGRFFRITEGDLAKRI